MDIWKRRGVAQKLDSGTDDQSVDIIIED